MQGICAILYEDKYNHSKTNQYTDSIWEQNLTGLNLSDEKFNQSLLEFDDENRNILEDDVPRWGFVLVVTWIIIPGLCVFGVIGNLLNLLAIFLRMRERVDQMEKGALIGMVALALSDVSFCLVTLCGKYLLEDSIYYTRKNASFFFTMYGTYMEHTLIKTSTWFTVIMAVGRYLAVCYPLKARQRMRPLHTTLAIVGNAVCWISFYLPLMWTLRVVEIQCPTQKLLFITTGKYMEQKQLRKYLTYAWAGFGFLIPVAVLAFCNFKLIQSLRVSRQLRLQSNKHLARHRDLQHRINVTLVGVVAMFFFCMCPGEIFTLYMNIAFEQKIKFSYTTPLIVCNLLQVVNFSSNFALYCAVNPYFRRALWKLKACSWNSDESRFVLDCSCWRQTSRSPPHTSLMSMTACKRSQKTCQLIVEPEKQTFNNEINPQQETATLAAM